RSARPAAPRRPADAGLHAVRDHLRGVEPGQADAAGPQAPGGRLMSGSLYLRRRLKNTLALLLAGAATLFGLLFLAWILWTTLGRGIAAFDLALFTQMTPPPGQDGGMANALFGSVVMSLLAVAIGAPVGIAAGTF